jgi:hypothetical protein
MSGAIHAKGECDGRGHGQAAWPAHPTTHTASRSLRSRAFVLALTAWLGASAAVAAGADDAPSEVFDDAMQLYRDCRWAAAYGRFARLADAGHAESARIAMLMLWHGQRLYGTQWSAPQAQIERWSQLAVLSLPPFSADGGD